LENLGETWRCKDFTFFFGVCFMYIFSSRSYLFMLIFVRHYGFVSFEVIFNETC
jgi:hypothetical protein